MKAYIRHTFLFAICLAISVLNIFGQSRIINNETIKANDGTKTYIIAKSLVIQPPNVTQSVVFQATGSVSYSFRMANPDAKYMDPSLNQNFVRTETVLIPDVTNESVIKDLPVDQKNIVYNYSDGLGRP